MFNPLLPQSNKENIIINTPSDQIRSVTQSCPTLCDPMNRSTPGLPVHHHLPDFTQTHVRRIGDAIQPSHPPSSLVLPPPIPPSIRVFSKESTHLLQFSSVTQSCQTLCNPMNCSTPGLPVRHQLPEFTQTHVHNFMAAVTICSDFGAPKNKV